ncbi:hypothetical protein ABFS83_14G318100 [Erythranthe nasuta]
MQGGLFCYFLVLVLFCNTNTNTNTKVDASSIPPSLPPTSLSDYNAKNYVVYMSEKPPQYLNPKAYYIHVLSSVLGSEKAAEDALIYSYGVISGFAAKLNPEQASRLKDQPGIIYVSREIKYQPEENHRIKASTVFPNIQN